MSTEMQSSLLQGAPLPTPLPSPRGLASPRGTFVRMRKGTVSGRRVFSWARDLGVFREAEKGRVSPGAAVPHSWANRMRAALQCPPPFRGASLPRAARLCTCARQSSWQPPAPLSDTKVHAQGISYRSPHPRLLPARFLSRFASTTGLRGIQSPKPVPYWEALRRKHLPIF